MSKTPSEVAANLRKMRKALEDELVKFHLDAAIIIRDEREKAFMRGAGPNGEKWEPLKPKTIERKKAAHKTLIYASKKKNGPQGIRESQRNRKAKYPDKPLIDTMAMMKPTVESDKTEGRVIMAKSRGERISNEGSIAQIHDKGTSKIPKRPHWGIHPMAKRRIQLAYKRFLDGIVMKYGNG